MKIEHNQMNKCVESTEVTKRISNELRLSVLLVTYNHEKHIRQALNGLLNQQFEGIAEIVVADDASTDRTLEIIKEYEKKNDRFIFNYLNNKINLGITKNYQRGFESCSGEYVAVLEGDDYWVSPFKLQRQMQFLDEHWECDLCCVNYFSYEEEFSRFCPRIAIGSHHRFVNARDIIVENFVGNFSICMYRKTALDALPKELFDIRSYDWIVNICVAQKSMIGFLEEPMSVYRVHSNGLWSQTPYVKQLEQLLEVIPAYDALTHHTYHDDFNNLTDRLHSMIAKSNFIHIVSSVTKPTTGFLNHIVDCLPPFVLSLIRATLPPKLKRLIVRFLRRGAA